MQIFISLFQQQLKFETLTLFHRFSSPQLPQRLCHWDKSDDKEQKQWLGYDGWVEGKRRRMAFRLWSELQSKWIDSNSMNAKLVVEQFGRHDRHEGNFTFIPATMGLQGVWLRGRITDQMSIWLFSNGLVNKLCAINFRGFMTKRRVKDGLNDVLLMAFALFSRRIW